MSIAQKLPGVLGARLTGAGFGGATVTLCERERAQEIATELSKRYAAESGITPRVFVCGIAGGALPVAAAVSAAKARDTRATTEQPF